MLGNRIRQNVSAVLLTFLCIAGCGGLPGDFESLSLEEQVVAYERNFDRKGGPLLEARAHISWHGWRAADLMAEYLVGKRTGLPDLEAIRILHDVQSRGCSLKGTAGERALEAYLTRAPAGSVNAEFARTALEAIRNDSILPGGPDWLKGGPCATEGPARVPLKDGSPPPPAARE